MFDHGRTPEGVCDMAGNMWELVDGTWPDQFTKFNGTRIFVDQADFRGFVFFVFLI